MKAWIHLFRVNKELGFTQEYVLGGWKNVFSDVDSSTKGGGERNSGWGEKNNFSKLIEHQQYSFTSMQCLVTALGSKAPAD